MNVYGYLNINSKGRVRFTRSRVNLSWNEITLKISMNIPDIFFKRPTIEASIKIDENIIPKPQPIEVVLNTKELIEESTGVKVDFRILPVEETKEP